MRIRIVAIRPNCFRIYEVSHFDAKVQWYFGLFDFVGFIHEDRKQFATPLPRTWETDVSCDWSKICYRNHLPIISRSSKRYRISLGLKLAPSFPQVSGVATGSGEAIMVETVHYR